MTTGSIAFSADETRHRRTHTIGSDHEVSRYLALPIMAILEPHAGDATVVLTDQVDELRFEHHLGTGCLRGVETFDVGLRLDPDRDDLVAVVKRRRADHGGASGFDSLQDTPARELDDAGAHEGVGRDRIAPVATAVDREHTKASSREEQRGGRAGASGSGNHDVEIDGWGGDGANISTASDAVAGRGRWGNMSSNIDDVWPRGIPRVGQIAERSRTVDAKDIERFTEISGDRNPLHYDEAVAKASRFGEIVVQGGVTSAILNAVVAEDLPGPGTVFLQVNWSFKAPVRPGDTITGRAEVLEVRSDKPITKLKTSVIRDDGTLVLDGDAVCYTMPIATSTT
jgi:acyl dehydratase